MTESAKRRDLALPPGSKWVYRRPGIADQHRQLNVEPYSDGSQKPCIMYLRLDSVAPPCEHWDDFISDPNIVLPIGIVAWQREVKRLMARLAAVDTTNISASPGRMKDSKNLRFDLDDAESNLAAWDEALENLGKGE